MTSYIYVYTRPSDSVHLRCKFVCLSGRDVPIYCLLLLLLYCLLLLLLYLLLLRRSLRLLGDDSLSLLGSRHLCFVCRRQGPLRGNASPSAPLAQPSAAYMSAKALASGNMPPLMSFTFAVDDVRSGSGLFYSILLEVRSGLPLREVRSGLPLRRSGPITFRCHYL